MKKAMANSEAYAVISKALASFAPNPPGEGTLPGDGWADLATDIGSTFPKEARGNGIYD